VLVVPDMPLSFGIVWPGWGRVPGVPGVPAGLVDPGVVPVVVPVVPVEGLITLPLVAELSAGDPVVELVPAVVPVVALLSVLLPVVALFWPGRPVVLEPIVPVPDPLVPLVVEPTVPVPVVVEPVVPSVVLPVVAPLWPAVVPVVPCAVPVAPWPAGPDWPAVCAMAGLTASRPAAAVRRSILVGLIYRASVLWFAPRAGTW
jgi:hypothetical protein